MPPRAIPLIAVVALAAACTSAPAPSQTFPTASWRFEDGQDAPYLLAPGDTLELTVHTAPELNRTVEIAPDGRVRLPLIGAVAAAARTPEAVERLIGEAYRSQLRSPQVELVVSDFGSQQIFVGGEVANPGLFDLPGQIDPLQAIIMAGGRTNSASPRHVYLLRRLPGGEMHTAIVDMREGLAHPAAADWLALRRFDVVYVPRSGIARQNLFVQQYIRDALPIEFSLFYDIAGNSD